MEYDEYGREIPDPRPIAVPANWQRPLSLHDQIKRFIRTEMSRSAEDSGEESFEDADDFDVDEDPDPFSPYEIAEAAVEAPGGVKDVDADPPLTAEEKAPKRAKKAPGGDPPDPDPVEQ